MIATRYTDEMVAVLKDALNLAPEEVATAREALAVAWDDKLAIVWTFDDVIEIGRAAYGHAITSDEARDVLFFLDTEHDPKTGITTAAVIDAIKGLGFARA